MPTFTWIFSPEKLLTHKYLVNTYVENLKKNHYI